jgi:hypothetical protein
VSRISLVAVILTFSAFILGCNGEAPDERGIAPEAEAAAPDIESGSESDSEDPRGLVARRSGVSDGYVLYSPLLSKVTYLIDNDGLVVHAWPGEFVGSSPYLQDDGSLLQIARDPSAVGFTSGGVGGYVEELDWNAEVTWRWHFASEEAINHHDIEPLPNGNILVIGWELRTQQESLRAGRRPELTPKQGLWPDFLLEIEPTPPNDAHVVWEWHAWDHLIQDWDSEAPNHGKPSEHPGRIDLNAHGGAAAIGPDQLAQLKALGYVPADATLEDLESDFLHVNAVAYNEGLDQIAISAPEFGEIWILDHSTTTAEAAGSTGGRQGRGGDLLYRWGNPHAYGRGEREDRQLYYQHDIRWIPDGWAGGGNLLVFDNGPQSSNELWSAVVEITPPVTAEGGYMLPAGGAFGPAKPHWEYMAPDPETFFAPFVSGAHRLENGNTFICEGPAGRLFELDANDRIVWEYTNPYSEGVQEEDGWVPAGTADNPFGVFRATRIPSDHPGLAGHALAPLDPQPPRGIYRP